MSWRQSHILFNFFLYLFQSIQYNQQWWGLSKTRIPHDHTLPCRERLFMTTTCLLWFVCCFLTHWQAERMPSSTDKIKQQWKKTKQWYSLVKSLPLLMWTFLVSSQIRPHLFTMLQRYVHCYQLQRICGCCQPMLVLIAPGHENKVTALKCANIHHRPSYSKTTPKWLLLQSLGTSFAFYQKHIVHLKLLPWNCMKTSSLVNIGKQKTIIICIL